MGDEIKPIETHYNGYRFRSRLEARWAVYFDTMGIKYEYEKEGYNLGELGNYLPDFWLPEVKFWAEVKPIDFSWKELEKLKQLSIKTIHPSIQLVGTPEVKTYNTFIPWKVPPEYFPIFGNVTLTEYPFYICNWVHSHGTTLYHGNATIDFSPDNLYHGVESARSVRFEFGETPQIKTPKSKFNSFKSKMESLFDFKVEKKPEKIKKQTLTKGEIIRRVMEKEFQIVPEAVDKILSSPDPEKTLDLSLKNIKTDIIIIGPEHVCTSSLFDF